MYAKRSTAKKLRMYRAELRRRQENGEDLFNYCTFMEMTLPEIYKRNFLDLAWKMCCNVSDNTYNQMKYTKDDDFWNLKVCKK